MKKHLMICAFALALFIVNGCKYATKYTIDEQPIVKINSGLLGIWRAAEDTNKDDYFFIQTDSDAFNQFAQRYATSDVKYRSESQYKIEKKELLKNDNIYYISYLSNAGARYYEQWPFSISVISNNYFLNIGGINSALNGYFFVKIIRVNEAYDTITACIVNDDGLKSLNSSKEVRNRIAKNINNPNFYTDTMHFYKMDSYHSSIEGSYSRAK